MRNSGGTGISIFCVVAGLIIEAMFFYLFDVDVKSTSIIVILFFWFLNAFALGYIYWRFFGDGKNRKDRK